MNVASDGHGAVLGSSAEASAAGSATAAASRPDLFAGEGFELGLVAGLGAGEVARRLAVAMRGGEACHRALAFYLHDMETRRAHGELGFASAVDFARRRLGMSKGRARDLLLAGRKLAELPQLDGAFAEGRLSWSKVRRIARVATAETEAAWIARAAAATHEEVDALVAVAKEGETPRDLDRGLPATRFVKRFVFDVVQHELFEQARAKLQAELGRPVTDDEVLDDAVRLLLATSADGSVPGRRAVDGSLFRVDVPGDAAAGGAAAGDTAAGDTAAGDPNADNPAADNPAAGDPAVGDATAGNPATRDPAVEAARSDAVPPRRLRRRVIARDGHRCRACDSRRHLMLHHVVWYSRGGPTTKDNLVTLCARCHGLVHDGFLRVTRAEGGGFRFADRHGATLDGRHPAMAAAVTVTACAVAHASPPAPVPEGVAALGSEADIPDVVDAAWWRTHEHELEWTGRGIRVRAVARARARSPTQDPARGGWPTDEIRRGAVAARAVCEVAV